MPKIHTITIENILIYAYHGCLQEEALIGSDYRVDVEVKADLSKSCVSDELADTLDYVTMNEIIHQEMKIRSKLLEHVAQRIFERFQQQFPQLTYLKIKIAKINPPMGGVVDNVAVTLEESF